MSQMEYHLGKIKLLPRLNHESLDEQCKRVYSEKYPDLAADEVNDDWIDILLFSSHSYQKYIIHNNDLYEVFDHKEVEEDDCELKSIGDDTYEFRMAFYNGGTCLGECIGWELDRLEQNKKYRNDCK